MPVPTWRHVDGATQKAMRPLQRNRSRTIHQSNNSVLLTTDSSTTTTTSTTDSPKRIPLWRSLMQWTFCLAAVVLGFRVAHEMDLMKDHFSSSSSLEEDASNFLNQYSNQTGVKSSHVYVGRHPILVRPWPHPNPLEMAQAYRMIARVQLEQQRLYGIQAWKPVVAITPTFSRTFQSVHLTGLIHTLSQVRGSVTWVVIEAGGVSAGTAALLKQAKVHQLVHLAGASKRVPRSLQDRGILESHLRIEGLRYVREHSLEGVVVFLDDSNVYSTQFFGAIQKVEWVGALPVGMLGHAGLEEPVKSPGVFRRTSELQVQAPVCDNAKASNNIIVGWHAFGSLPLDGEEFVLARVRKANLEWAGFVLNARAVWKQQDMERPKWINDWTQWAHPARYEFVDVKSVVSDESKIEALGGCRKDDSAVLVWWARLEARSDSKWPSRWELDSPLEMTVPAKRTPWPDRVFPPPSPPRPAELTTKRKGGNRSGGRPRRGKRRPDPAAATTTIDTSNTGMQQKA